MNSDYLGRYDLLALNIDEAIVDRLLLETSLYGHDRQPVVEADRLNDLLALLELGGPR